MTVEMRKELTLKEIEVNQKFQNRKGSELDPDHVESMVRRPQTLPPMIVVLVRDGKRIRYILIDGFHRFEALSRLKRKTFLCLIREGTEHQAFLWSRGSNKWQAKNFTSQDRKYAIFEYFQYRVEHPYEEVLTDTAVAKEMDLDASRVSQLRREWEKNRRTSESGTGEGEESDTDPADDSDDDGPAWTPEPPDFARARKEAAELVEKMAKRDPDDQAEQRQGARGIIARGLEDAARGKAILAALTAKDERALAALWEGVPAE